MGAKSYKKSGSGKSSGQEVGAKRNRKKFGKGKFVFLFANVQNSLGEVDKSPWDFCGRSAKRGHGIW